MGGEQFAKAIEQLLAERDISKGEFYDAVGISATAMYGWKRGAKPKQENIEAVEKFFGVSLDDKAEKTWESNAKNAEKTWDFDQETMEILQMIKDEYAYKSLFRSAKGLSAADIYAAASLIEKLKAGEIKP